MAQILENELFFKDRSNLRYCGNCKTEMSFDGADFECPVCGSADRARTKVAL